MKKVLFTSIATIVLCFCLVAGSTFALFTDTQTVSIVVTSGKVQMAATPEVTGVQSIRPATSEEIESRDPGLIGSEELGWYMYYTPGNNEFHNGGNVTLDEENALLSLSGITPGDRAFYTINGTNESSLPVVYRYRIEYYYDASYRELYPDREYSTELMSTLIFTIQEGENGEVQTITNMESYVSPWYKLDVDENGNGLPMEPILVTVEFPYYIADNTLQDKYVEIRILVEAIQSNADVPLGGRPTIDYYDQAGG